MVDRWRRAIEEAIGIPLPLRPGDPPPTPLEKLRRGLAEVGNPAHRVRDALRKVRNRARAGRRPPQDEDEG
jgi:hypothetical protein